MGLREWLSSRRQASQYREETQTLQAHCDKLQEQCLQLRDACQQLRWQCEDARIETVVEQHRREGAQVRVDCLADLFRTFAAQPIPAERLYDRAAPHLDPDGFRLYHASVRATGVVLSTAFPYEENCGEFAFANGHTLLRYLEAAHFGAVTWEIVPGTTYERAVLGEVDRQSPEYLKFRETICEKALDRMGLGELLKEPEKEELKHEREQHKEKEGLRQGSQERAR